MGDGTEPIADDELLFRRIPPKTNWYNPAKSPKPDHRAFGPQENDETGLSLDRQKYNDTPQEAARKGRGAQYYIAVLRAGDIRARGLRVEPRPRPADPGHAEISDLTYECKKTTESLNAQQTLAAELCLEVLGPVPGSSAPTSEQGTV